jgi:asparagine synthase (glutamine-hydrolysing)
MKPYIQNIDKVGLLNPLTDIENVKLKVIATLENAVINRLNSDRPIGCLLSGGLDSSLVAGIAARELKDKGMKLKTFSIGMTGGTDLKYARMVADYIDSEHTEVIFTPEEGLSVLEDVIKTTETFDITTIRASVGQYLLSKWISQNTDIKVILNGDGADECQMGYLYNYYSPSHIESHKDCIRLLDNIHLYDGLRVDRCISRWGLEARVPYLDKNFVNLYKIIHPNLKMPIRGERMEKWLIRSAFERSKLIPKEVLWRIKEAFSDGVSNTENSWFSILQKHTIPSYNKVYIHCPPISNESRYYREIFEKIFGDEVSHVIPYFWMPKWIQSNDPSARTLPLYVG